MRHEIRWQRGAWRHWHAARSASARPHVRLTSASAAQYLEAWPPVLLLLLVEPGLAESQAAGNSLLLVGKRWPGALATRWQGFRAST